MSRRHGDARRTGRLDGDARRKGRSTAARRAPGDVALLRRPRLPLGFRLAGVACGLKPARRGRGGRPLDLALIACDRRTPAAAVFTTNQFAAAPVEVCREHLARSLGLARAVVANSGCANAATGDAGLRQARAVAASAAGLLGCRSEEVLVASTGVIGRPLRYRQILKSLPGAVRALSAGTLDEAARAIMTTDTRPKIRSAEALVDGRVVTVTGIAKGSGMIHPRLATMLVFLMTDAAVHPYLLRRLLRDVVRQSFNVISVDGDSSTNDTVVLMASGAAGRRSLLQAGPREAPFVRALLAVCRALALDIVTDGEGARRILEIEVAGARRHGDADRIARSVANSPLVKTALAGGDPNWGRILSAAGAAGVPFRPSAVSLRVGTLPVVRQGCGTGQNGAALRRLFTAPRVSIRLDVGAGPGRAVLWTCDLTRRYIDINARYTT
ncbi:MAG TPA: bifunctional glutamate N-acetyltransferase/amino-acid acetyltransferase ArgJ [Candidatus Polarisedimenticolia bacterium]|nr:bifunctional glutamate N-acetyltransferase/amino-acid acetyltransferase ArgJ [Candidatus Polarisedimenticolia bacterium]